MPGAVAKKPAASSEPGAVATDRQSERAFARIGSSIGTVGQNVPSHGIAAPRVAQASGAVRDGVVGDGAVVEVRAYPITAVAHGILRYRNAVVVGVVGADTVGRVLVQPGNHVVRYGDIAIGLVPTIEAYAARLVSPRPIGLDSPGTDTDGVGGVSLPWVGSSIVCRQVKRRAPMAQLLRRSASSVATLGHEDPFGWGCVLAGSALHRAAAR